MNSLLHELFTISDNEALFKHLASGELLEDFPAPRDAKSRRRDLLVQVGGKLIESIRSSDTTALETLLAELELYDQIVVIGEIQLTVAALHERGEDSAFIEAITNLAFEMLNACAQSIEDAVHAAKDTGDELDSELEIHAMALREWAHLQAEHYQTVGDENRFAQMMFVRAKVTNSAADKWPQLVGDGMVSLAQAAIPIGQADLAIQCLNGVRLDLAMYVESIDDPKLPGYEAKAATYWLQQACTELCKIHPEDEETQQLLAAVTKLRTERNLPPIPSTPRLGPLARTYLDRIPWLSIVIKDLHTNKLESDDELIAYFCQRYGVVSWDVEFYISAIGSYHARKMLEGMQISYDESHEEVFAAIDYQE